MTRSLVAGLSRRRRRPVADQLSLEVESAGPVVDGDRVAVVASYTESAWAPRSLNELLRQLRAHGHRVVLVSTSPAAEPLQFDPDVASDITVIRRPNVGYDFGSWAVGLAWDRSIAEHDRVLLTNDSMIGPFTSLEPVLDALDQTSLDVLGLTDSSQFCHHLQSYFLGFTHGVLTEEPLRRFWDQVRHHDDKQDVIWQGELALSRLLRREGFSVAALHPWEESVAWGENPVIRAWESLLDQGFPFVKREILLRPDVAPEGHSLPRVILERFDEHVEDWI